MGGEAGAGAGRPAVGEKADVDGDPWEYRLRKYLLLLATLVATVTYSSAFSPPGGVWQDADPAENRIAGDPIIRETSYPRYLAFFYCNATAFASSLVVIVFVLILAVLHERGSASLAPLRILRVVMVLDLLSLMGAYAAGAFRDRLTATYSLALLACAIVYLAVHMLLAWHDSQVPPQPPPPDHQDQQQPGDVGEKKTEEEKRKEETALEKLRKVLMLLGTFAVSVTYVAGLSAPGGFWDHPEGAHRPGDAVLKGGRHDKRLKAFFVLNTTAFVASLLVIVILLEKKLCFSRSVRSAELYGFIAVMLIGLVGAYSAGSCRQIDTTIYVNSLIGAVVAFVLLQAAIINFCQDAIEKSCLWQQLGRISVKVKGLCLGKEEQQDTQDQNTTGNDQQSQVQLEKARSLVLLLATLAAAITYQAGLNPPGGLWQSDGDRGGHDRYMAGDPVLLTMSPRRYKAFYYCNSVALVASLVAIVLVRMETLHHHNALEAAMILDLFGLIGAYAAGSCRDVATSIYAMALAGTVLVYVVIHVVFFTLDHSGSKERGDGDDEELVEKRRKRLLLFAILAATITYQAGLTPPSGFLAKDDPDTENLAGDPVLLNNYPRRYTAFFYCNSVSFMLSIALIILLVNPNLYRPAIRSNALSVCTAAGMIGIMGAYAAGCTQHLKTSIYIFALAGFVLAVAVVAVASLAIHDKKQNNITDASTDEQDITAADDIESTTGAQNLSAAAQPKSSATAGGDHMIKPNKAKLVHAKRKYLMLLGILVASVTYQAGLAPPGGVWQANDKELGHAAGDPVMHDNRRPRYLAFYYSNSASFVASVVVIVLLLPQPPKEDSWWWQWRLGLMKTTVVLDLLGLLVAYAAGSSRSWKTAGSVSALVVAVLAYFVIHVAISCSVRGKSENKVASMNKIPLQRN
ncbi:hypothetical protein BS78_04G177900 [Paspalum vaginatum]|nr:hypothetical protein BS78_04G177900 [Paspalum vaginatum]